MKFNYLSLLGLYLAAQAIALSIPARSNFARGDEIEDGTQIAEGWKRSADATVFARGDEIEDGTQIAEGWKRSADAAVFARGDEIEDGTQIAEGW